MPIALGSEFLGQSATDLVEDQANERLGPADVGGRDDEIERHGPRPVDEIGDAPVAAPGNMGDDGIAIEAQERHGGREHARSFVVGLVEQFASSRGDDRMDLAVAEMRGGHHRAQGRLDRAARVRQEGGDAGERLVGFGVEDVEDRADQQGVAGLLPVVALLEAAFGVDQHVGDVLRIAHFPLALADFEQGIVRCRCRIGRIEQQHASVQRAEAGGELPVLALDIMDDAALRPGE